MEVHLFLTTFDPSTLLLSIAWTYQHKQSCVLASGISLHLISMFFRSLLINGIAMELRRFGGYIGTLCNMLRRVSPLHVPWSPSARVNTGPQCCNDKQKHLN